MDIQIHDNQKALAAYREATELDPSNADTWNKLGHVLLRTGDLGAAEAAYLKVEELAGGDKEWLAINFDAKRKLARAYFAARLPASRT